jgi:hypothetical protein
MNRNGRSRSSGIVGHDAPEYPLVRAGGREWALNFRSQIARVKEAMEILGVNTSEPLMAPPLGPADGDEMKREDDNDEA